ncbi:hypothetical protein BH23VER1_BH23VER1_21960 [soil metagenome]
MDREEKITRWIDGALPETERIAFETELARDPQLRAEAEMATRIGESLRAGLRSPAEDIPAAEFFNAKLANTIRHGGHHVEAAGSPPRRTPVFGSPWVVAAAACAVAAFSLFSRLSGDGGDQLRPMAYVPDPSVGASVYYDDAAGATVIMFDGLAEIPAEREVQPFSVASHPFSPDGKTTFRSDGPAGEPLFVMLAGGSGPLFNEL